MRRTWNSQTAYVDGFDISTATASVSLLGLPLAWLSDEEKQAGVVFVEVGCVLQRGSRIELDKSSGHWRVLDVDP